MKALFSDPLRYSLHLAFELELFFHKFFVLLFFDLLSDCDTVYPLVISWKTMPGRSIPEALHIPYVLYPHAPLAAHRIFKLEFISPHHLEGIAFWPSSSLWHWEVLSHVYFLVCDPFSPLTYFGCHIHSFQEFQGGGPRWGCVHVHCRHPVASVHLRTQPGKLSWLISLIFVSSGSSLVV